MGSMRGLLGFTVVLVAFIATSMAAGRCPPPSKIYDYTSKASCRNDYDCKNGKVCCMNPANVKSCTYPDPYSGGGGSKPSGGPGVYCEGVKCQPFEVCKMDSLTKRMKCQRA